MATLFISAVGQAGIVWYLIILAAAAYLASAYRDYVRLKAFRGPWASGWTSLWLARTAGGGQANLEFWRLCEKYGSIARVAPGTLITSSPELISRMSAARSPWMKSSWYAALRLPPGQDNLFSQMDEKKHTLRKAQMAEGYTGKTNLALESTVDAQVVELIKLIRSKYLSTDAEFKPMDVARKAAFFTMDVITDLAFGKPFGDLTNDKDMYRYIQSTEEMLPMVSWLTAIPAISALFQISWISKLIFPSEKDSTGVGKLIGIARKSVDDRFASDSSISRKDMTASFIAHGLSKNDLITESLLQIVAGADTTATALRSTLLHIITHPSVYSALQSEIDRCDREGRLSSPVVQEAEAQRMPYLQAVIREGLRIWPPVTGLLSKVAPPAGDEVEVDGRKIFIPGGTNVGWCVWGIHRNKELFGEDADMFRPERWLVHDGERLARMQKTVDLVFGYGKYMCLGRGIAMLEMNKVFVELLRHFDLEVVNSAKPWDSSSVGLFIQSNFFVRVTERKLRDA